MYLLDPIGGVIRAKIKFCLNNIFRFLSYNNTKISSRF